MAKSKAWTRNYDNLFSALYGTFALLQNQQSSTATYDKPSYKSINGSWWVIPTDAYNERFITFSPHASWLYGLGKSGSYYDSLRIQLGSGEGVSTPDNYCLFLPIDSGFTMNTITKTWVYDSNTHTYTKTFVFPLLYTGADPVTVTEFGIFADLGVYNSNSNNSIAMLYHEFIDEPRTLNKNDVIEITFEQSIAQPNYTPYPTTE